MKKTIFLGITLTVLVLMIGACSKPESTPHSQSETGSSRKLRYYTCSMHPQIHSDHPGTCPICGMQLTPVYEENSSPVPESNPTPSVPSSPKSKKILYYVDPMHPQYKSDKPGKAPDCGMDLVPVYEEGENKPKGESVQGTIQLSREKQQLIGVKTEEVQERPLIREIHATGRVAYHPDLFVAQSEYLTALQNARLGDPTATSFQRGLIQSTKLKLKLLGMSEEQIQELARTRKAQSSLLLPQSEGMNWIYGSIFESDLPWVKTGDTVQVFIPGRSESYQTVIASIDPTIDPMTRTAQIRLRLPQSSGFLKPDLYLKLVIEARVPSALTIPESALLDTGKQTSVFVDRGNGKFEVHAVKVGRRGTGFIEILSGLSKGDRVVTSANFLLDSEFKLKTGVSAEGDSHD